MGFPKDQKTKLKLGARNREFNRASKKVMYKQRQGNAFDTEEIEDNLDEAIENPEDETYGDYGDAELEEGINGRLFTKVDINLFCQRILDIVIPTGARKMSSNLGESKHGSLRAAQ